MRGYDPRQWQALLDQGLVTEIDELTGHYGPEHAGATEWSLLLPGPMEVSSSFEAPSTLDDDASVSVRLGTLNVVLTYEGAHALTHTLLAALAGPRAAAALLAVMERLPENLEDHVVVSRVLWRAANTWAHLWPQRYGGYNDALWGCRTPEFVPFRLPLEPGNFYQPPVGVSETWIREAKDAAMPPPKKPRRTTSPNRPPPQAS